MKAKNDSDLEVTTGNVFAALDLPNAEESYLKAQLLVAILRRVEAEALSRADVARATGLPQSNVSLLLNARLRGFSVARLFTIMNRLGMAVEVRVVDQPAAPPAVTTVRMPAKRRAPVSTRNPHRASQPPGSGRRAKQRHAA